MLTKLKCDNAKLQSKPYKLSDSHGLYLQVTPKGQKYWRHKYRYGGKERILSLGVYPEISILEAREQRDKARKQLRDGQDPAFIKKSTKLFNIERTRNIFEKLAYEWVEHNRLKWSPIHYNGMIYRLKKEVFPFIGSMPLDDITPRFIYKLIQAIQERGANETARRVRQCINQIFGYGIAVEKVERNPAAEIQKMMRPFKRGNYKALDYRELGEFLKTLDYNNARLLEQTKLSIKFVILTLVRTNELINARWREIDLESAQWIIPAERMKMRRDHVVPLSEPAIDILRRLQVLNPYNCRPGVEEDWVVPLRGNPRRQMSNGAMLGALRQIEFHKKTTIHGFRAMAMTALQEKLGYPHAVVDRQLAHASADKLGRAYDRAEFLEQRKEMMGVWGAYVESQIA